METVKKKFMAVAKKKQTEYLAKLKEKTAEQDEAAAAAEVHRLAAAEATNALTALQCQLGAAEVRWRV